MKNVRKSFEVILRKWGYNILIQRRTNTDNTDKKVFVNKLERHTVRSRLPSSPIGYTQEEDQGVMHNADMIYYFKWDANPREGDRIYENYGRDDNDLVLFEITFAQPMRGHHGRIDFWTVGAQRVTE